MNLGSGVSIPGQVTLTPCSCFLTQEDFLNGSAPQHRVHTLVSCDSPSIPELCLLSITMSLAPSSWHLIWLLDLDPQTPLVGMAPTGLVPLLELTPPTTSHNLPCSSLTEVRLKLSELSRSAPKTNIVNFNGRAHHFFNNSWFSESKADGVTKHFSAKTNSTWFQKH